VAQFVPAPERWPLVGFGRENPDWPDNVGRVGEGEACKAAGHVGAPVPGSNCTPRRRGGGIELDGRERSL
jgi:hypothetical protein